MALASLASAIASPSTWTASAYVLLLSIVVYSIVALFRRPTFSPKSPPAVEALPIVGALRFFTARGDFLSQSRDASPTGQFAFYVGKKQIIGLSGEHGRRTFFESRDLDFTAGYAVLFSAQPTLQTNDMPVELNSGAKILRIMQKLIRGDVLAHRIPVLVSDAREAMESIIAAPRCPKGGGGAVDCIVVDPFEDMFRLVYRLTMRTLGCDDFAEDPEKLRKTLALFEAIDAGAAAPKIIFPWMFTLGQAQQLWSGYRMYRMIAAVIKDRRRTGRKRDDALQLLLDQGEGVLTIVEFIISALFAGLINSGINAAWLLCYLAADRAKKGAGSGWYTKIREEVDAAVARHRVSDDETPAAVLGRLGIAEWESEFPAIDLGLRETIRFTITGCGFRQNVSGRDVPIGDSGQVVPSGAFAVYLFDDLHMNPEFYPEPERWNPGRYLSDPEDDNKASPHRYIGWGSGRHPCLGMRFAKMEMAITTAMFFASFDFELCDEHGAPTSTPTGGIDRNKHSASKPDPKVFLKVTPR